MRVTRCVTLICALQSATLADVTSAQEDGARERGQVVAAIVCSGSQPCLSPDGQLLAHVRWRTDPTMQDLRGNPTWVPHLWVRDLESDHVLEATRISDVWGTE